MKHIREEDWRRLRDIQPIALDRFCFRVLADIKRASSDPTVTAHQRYSAVYGLIRERDKELGYIFDGLSRSCAIQKLLLMHRAGLLTEDEVAAFSEDIRNIIARSSDE
jgi:hypothetical protein